MTTYWEIQYNLPCVVRMPYTIRKCPNQDAYKVRSQSGRPLSKKCLPLERAKKQRTAAILSEIGLSRPGTFPLGRTKAKKFIK